MPRWLYNPAPGGDTAAMLAYLFWHRPYPEVPTADYEAALLAFHRALSAVACPGFLGSATFRISATPWLERPGYEDWSLLNGSWALDLLNRAAVSGDMEPVHAAVADRMELGFGGLYRRLFGDPEFPDRSRLWWITRPRRTRCEETLRAAAGGFDGAAGCWRRQMVLGPAPEFALVAEGDREPALPAGWSAFVEERARIGA